MPVTPPLRPLDPLRVLATLRLLALPLLGTVFAAAVPALSEPVFHISLDASLADTPDTPVSGRLFVLANPDEMPLAASRASAARTQTAAIEVHDWKPGSVFDFLPSRAASYPKSFLSAPGRWHFQALLDLDHSYAYSGAGDGDLESPDVAVESFDVSRSQAVSLTLSHRHASPPNPESDRVHLFSYRSALLSDFWKRPISMQATVVLPREAAGKDAAGPFPVVYIVPGFGAGLRYGFGNSQRLVDSMDSGIAPRMIYVFLDPSFFSGHHVFADSVNNGPWGRALTSEFIPAVEKAYPAAARPAGRFLCGHSSGGWSTLWLMVTYPDVFGGTWSTSPDPTDFRSFSGVDLTRNPPENLYRDAAGKPRNLMRRAGRDLMSMEEFVRQEEVAGPVGGQFASFEWVFSPRGEDGQPRRLFDRASGAVDPDVARAWEKYDIRKVLANGWQSLAGKLDGKIHLIVGEDDNFHLEEAAKYLFGFFQARDREKPFDVRMELHLDRDHFDLYRGGLDVRMFREMERAWLQTKS